MRGRFASHPVRASRPWRTHAVTHAHVFADIDHLLHRSCQIYAHHITPTTHSFIFDVRRGVMFLAFPTSRLPGLFWSSMSCCAINKASSKINKAEHERGDDSCPMTGFHMLCCQQTAQIGMQQDGAWGKCQGSLTERGSCCFDRPTDLPCPTTKLVQHSRLKLHFVQASP